MTPARSRGCERGRLRPSEGRSGAHRRTNRATQSPEELHLAGRCTTRQLQVTEIIRSSGSDHTLLHRTGIAPYVVNVAAILDPFSARGPSEVPLERSPLVRVIAQLRFPAIVSLGSPEFIGPFQESIRQRYPILRKEQSTGVMIGPGGVLAQQPDGVVCRFQDKANVWRVSLAQDFIALESDAYKNRDDFLGRFEEIVVALDQLARMPVYDRLGVRYINRVSGPELEKLSALVRPEVVGLAATDAVGLNHTLTESVFIKADMALTARWGRLPPEVTTDPASLSPIPGPSWLLDLDMFRAGQRDFDTGSILEDGRMFATTIHDFFRWCVTDDFLEAYGGKP